MADGESSIGNGKQNFKIPALVLITAFVLGLIGVAGWSLALERGKADKGHVVAIQEAVTEMEKEKADRNELAELRGEIKEIARDVKVLLRRY